MQEEGSGLNSLWGRCLSSCCDLWIAHVAEWEKVHCEVAGVNQPMFSGIVTKLTPPALRAAWPPCRIGQGEHSLLRQWPGGISMRSVSVIHPWSLDQLRTPEKTWQPAATLPERAQSFNCVQTLHPFGTAIPTPLCSDPYAPSTLTALFSPTNDVKSNASFRLPTLWVSSNTSSSLAVSVGYMGDYITPTSEHKWFSYNVEEK